MISPYISTTHVPPFVHAKIQVVRMLRLPLCMTRHSAVLRASYRCYKVSSGLLFARALMVRRSQKKAPNHWARVIHEESGTPVRTGHAMKKNQNQPDWDADPNDRSPARPWQSENSDPWIAGLAFTHRLRLPKQKKRPISIGRKRETYYMTCPSEDSTMLLHRAQRFNETTLATRSN